MVVHLYDPELANEWSELKLSQALSAQVVGRCLISDDDINPYTMTLVSRDLVCSVSVDPDRLDRRSEYWLAVNAE